LLLLNSVVIEHCCYWHCWFIL